MGAMKQGPYTHSYSVKLVAHEDPPGDCDEEGCLRDAEFGVTANGSWLFRKCWPHVIERWGDLE